MIKVLLVDDKYEIRKLLTLAFQHRRDYAISEAADGTEAMKSIARSRPDLVILDIMMPGSIDGLDVLDAIRSNPEFAGMKVFMLSARTQKSDQKIAMEKGADAYFAKPFSIVELINVIDHNFQSQG